MQTFDFDQGTPEWFAARAGIITASEMSDVLAKGEGKTRMSYMYRLIGERMTGQPSESFRSKSMERGHELEPAVREIYEEEFDERVQKVGFVRNHDDIGGVGYSPDGLVGSDGCIEIKTKDAPLLVALLDKGLLVNKAHTDQIQCGLWVAEREWVDYLAYWPGLPLFRQRFYRDDAYISAMRAEVLRFYADAQEVMGRIVRNAA